MILLFDVGNTNITIGLSDEKKIISVYRLNTEVNKESDEYYIAINSLISKYGKIDAIAIASVVPRVTEKLKEISKKFYNLTPVVVEPGTKTGVMIKTDNPKEVGADLICAVAGVKDPNKPTLVIDLGTATKYIYTQNRTIIGVIIAAGVKISIKALVGNTALLHDIDIDTPKNVLGTTTATCMQSGVTYGVAAQVDGLIDRIREEVKTDFEVVLTGGLSPLILPLIKREARLNELLVLEGILNIYLKNKKKD